MHRSEPRLDFLGSSARKRDTFLETIPRRRLSLGHQPYQNLGNLPQGKKRIVLRSTPGRRRKIPSCTSWKVAADEPYITSQESKQRSSEVSEPELWVHCRSDALHYLWKSLERDNELSSGKCIKESVLRFPGF